MKSAWVLRPAALGLLALTLSAGGTADRQIAPYRGAPIELDGVMSVGEWDDAREFAMSGGGHCFVKRDEGALYIALPGAGPGVGQVYLGFADAVRVLRAAERLSELRYSKDEANWRLISSYPSEPADGRQPDEDWRARFLEDRGWVASSAEMGGAGALEFIVDLRGIAEPAIRIAMLRASGGGDALHWPTNLADGCISQALVDGRAPERIDIEPLSWIQIILQLE